MKTMRFRFSVLIPVLAGLPLLSVGAESESSKNPTVDQLPASVSRILAAYDMPSDGFSAYIQETSQDRPILAFNADTPRNPASTIKLLTTYLALEALGPAYRWKTESYLTGALNDGVLTGDLAIKGYGDPYLVTEKLWLFMRQMRQRGLQHVRGDLLIDNSYFEIKPTDAGEFDGQPFRTYNVVPDASLVNFNAIQFIFRPDPVMKNVSITADPVPANLEISNQLTLTSGRCGGYQNGINVAVAEIPKATRVTFSGNFGRDCRQYSLSRSVMQTPEYVYGVFKDIWESSGGTIQGRLRTAALPDDLDVFVSVDSPQLSELIRLINKWSNNVMTRHILLTMGVERFGPPGTVEKGRQAAIEHLSELGLDFPELELDNGAGLSRETRISTRNLGRLLLAADKSLFRAEFVSSLALAGLDGTMRRRFRNDELTGRMHMKTGRLDNVVAMAGFLRSRSGREFVVVSINNNTDAHRGAGEEAQTALIRWAYKL